MSTVFSKLNLEQWFHIQTVTLERQFTVISKKFYDRTDNSFWWSSMVILEVYPAWLKQNYLYKDKTGETNFSVNLDVVLWTNKFKDMCCEHLKTVFT